MNNQRIAQRFLEIADNLERSSANPFRVRAYRRAARTLERMKQDVADAARTGTLGKIPGIGNDLSAKIVEFVETGRISDPAPENGPPSPDPGPLPQVFVNLVAGHILDERLARLIHRRFHIDEPDDLARLVRSRLLRTLPQFEPELEQNVLEFLARNP